MGRMQIFSLLKQVVYSNQLAVEGKAVKLVTFVHGAYPSTFVQLHLCRLLLGKVIASTLRRVIYYPNTLLVLVQRFQARILI
jgi:hypothetical protein